MAILTTAGELYLASKLAAGQVPVIAAFVYANIVGLDTSVQPPKSEPMAAAQNIVDEQPVTQQGFVNPNQVVFSNILTSTMGGYDYNWIGLKADDGTLFAVQYTPTQHKYERNAQQDGDTQNWNVLTEFNGIAELTQINIPAASWQLDITSRTEKMDFYNTENMQDLFGEKVFIGVGFEVFKDGADHKIKAGVGYVQGLRVVQDVETILPPGSLPLLVYVDAYYQYIDLDRVITCEIKSASTLPVDYIDGNGCAHKIAQIASLAADGTVTDSRIIISANPAAQLDNKSNSDHKHRYDELTNRPTEGHQWSGTAVQFLNPDGSWGTSVDLKGETGNEPAHGWAGTSLTFKKPDGTDGDTVNLKGEKGETGPVSISDSTTTESSNTAASSAAVKAVQDALDSLETKLINAGSLATLVWQGSEGHVTEGILSSFDGHKVTVGEYLIESELGKLRLYVNDVDNTVSYTIPGSQFATSQFDVNIKHTPDGSIGDGFHLRVWNTGPQGYEYISMTKIYRIN